MRHWKLHHFCCAPPIDANQKKKGGKKIQQTFGFVETHPRKQLKVPIIAGEAILECRSVPVNRQYAT